MKSPLEPMEPQFVYADERAVVRTMHTSSISAICIEIVRLPALPGADCEQRSIVLNREQVTALLPHLQAFVEGFAPR